uniref:D-alanine-D-alanine ligase n=1 Tax=Candidatus Giovannonibacteria bacterium GW2011_GWF2_42_19 TaxID=1618659 RepID=A0A0G1CHD2_9BACT|nr:MAG: D-alanine-D-alanine ligase [Candidatus Giovannonibacteria bacterium GW2011_GWF2_42_19]
MAKINVGVLRGGPSSEYDISLKTGESVIANLLKEKYEVHDVLWTKDGVWHLDGFPKPVEKILRKVDVIFNA